MKLIDLLIKIANDEIEPPVYFRISTFGHNFIIKYLYYAFIIEDVKSSFSKSCFLKNEYLKLNIVLSSLNKTIELIDKSKGE